MPTLQELIDSPKDVAFSNQLTFGTLIVKPGGKLRCHGGLGPFPWFDVSGSADSVTMLNVNSQKPLGVRDGKLSLDPVANLTLHETGDGSVYFTTPNGKKGLCALPERPHPVALRPIDKTNVPAAFRFIPRLRGEGPFPLFSSAPPTTVEDGVIFRLKHAMTGRFFVLRKGSCSAGGGNGMWPWLKAVEKDDGLYLYCIQAGCFLHFADGIVTGTSTGTPITLQDAGNNTVKLLSADGNSLSLALQNYSVVSADSPQATPLIVVGGLPVPPVITKLAAKAGGGRRRKRLAAKAKTPKADEEESDDDDFLDEMDGLLSDSDDEDTEKFEEIISMPKAERRAHLKGLTPKERTAFREFAKHKAQAKLEAKMLRQQKRQLMEGKDTAEALAAAAEQHDGLADADPEAVEEVLAMEDSDDDHDNEEFERQKEEAERLSAEMQAQMKAQMEELRKQAEEQRQAMLEERRKMMAEQAAMRKQMEEDLAKMATEAETMEAEPEEEEEEPAEEEEEEGEEEAEGEEEGAGKASREDAPLEDVVLNENTIEKSVQLPAPTATFFAKDDFDAEAGASKLKQAFRGWGCNKDKVTEVVLSGSTEQRHKIVGVYKTMFGKHLLDDINSEVTRKTGRLVKQMFKTKAEYDAFSLKKACVGLGTTNSTLIEIIATRTNEEILDICTTYKQLYKKDLEDVIMSETSGSFKRLLISLLQGGRNEGTDVDEELAQREAELLHKSTKGWSTDKSSLNQVLALRNSAQLRATCNKYLEISGKDITYTLKKKLPASLSEGMITIIQCCRNPARYFAEKIYRACKGLGTADEALMRVILSRCEVDMQQIKDIYPSIAGVSLAHTLKKETRGHYRTILLALIGEGK